MANIVARPPIAPSTGLQPIFFAEALLPTENRIWLFEVSPQDISSSWNATYPTYTPIKVFLEKVGALTKTAISLPPPTARPHRVMLRIPWGKGKSGFNFGPYTKERAFMDQYSWQDGTPLLHTSTAQLRRLQAQQRYTPHSALAKWETRLACSIPTSIWEVTWLNYRSANENMFLWQLAYRVIATQHWRFPTRPLTDPSTWCTRCSLEEQEDVVHCIWECPLSRQCWQWGEFILGQASGNPNARLSLLPANVFVALPLPQEWRTLERLWHILRALICWQIWKDRNGHYMADKPASPQRVIRKSWYRLGIYLRKE